MTTLKNKLKSPLFILLVVGFFVAVGLMIYFGGWLLKALGSLFGIGGGVFGKDTLRQWAEADAIRQKEAQVALEEHRKKSEAVRVSFEQRARQLAAREALSEKQIERDKKAPADEQREALLHDAKKIDDLQ